MKMYETPLCELILLTPDVIMGSDENELAMSPLSDLFNLNYD